jgi:YHS domain-containing protein
MNIFKVLIIIVLLYVGYKIVTMLKRGKSPEAKAYRVNGDASRGEDLVQDPFCKTYVPKSQAYLSEVDGQQQYFCSRDCCEKYLSVKDNRSDVK